MEYLLKMHLRNFCFLLKSVYLIATRDYLNLLLQLNIHSLPVENTIKECNEDSMKKTPIPEVLSKDTVNVSGNELQSTEQAIPMDTIIEEDDGGAEAPEEEMILPDSEEQSVEMIPEETVHSTGINRQAWIGNLSTKDMAQYLSRNLSVSTLKSPDQLFNWLSDIVDNDGRFLEEGNQVR